MGVQRLCAVAKRYVEWAGEAPSLFATMYYPELATPLELLMLSAGDVGSQERLVQAEYGGDTRAASRRVKAFAELLEAKAGALDAFMSAIHAGMDDDSVRGDVSPVQLAHAVTSMADGLAWQRVTERQGSVELLDRHAEASLALLVDGIRRRDGG